ncbi:unnamed protein product, partial [marine sediment metagenome]
TKEGPGIRTPDPEYLSMYVCICPIGKTFNAPYRWPAPLYGDEAQPGYVRSFSLSHPTQDDCSVTERKLKAKNLLFVHF